jgi:CheY-like chemotaxis protein
MEDARHTSGEDTIKTVLIVEDDEDISLALSQVLKEDLHVRVVVARDGFAALKIIRTIQPDLFVVDYQMPAMDGLELVDTLRVRPESAQVPVLFMSARPPRSELSQRHLPCLEKPFELQYHLDKSKGSWPLVCSNPLVRGHERDSLSAKLNAAGPICELRCFLSKWYCPLSWTALLAKSRSYLPEKHVTRVSRSNVSRNGRAPLS